MNRCAVFLDAGYMENVMYKEHPGVKVDFSLLAEEMAGQDTLLRCYYYNCLPYLGEGHTDEERESYDKKRRFLDALAYLPNFEVRLGRLHRSYDNANRPYHYQKMVDIMLATDMLLMAVKGKVDSISLFTGDSDCVPVVEAVKREGVKVQLWHGSRGRDAPAPPSVELWKLCDERYDVATIIEHIRMQNTNQTTSYTTMPAAISELL